MEALEQIQQSSSEDITALQAYSLSLFTAEYLLLDAPIMKQVTDLRDKLSRSSDGTLIDYDDMFFRIQQEVDNLPTLELQMDIASGAEGAYQRQLIHALEKVNDDHDHVLRKVLKLKSRLLNAVDLMKDTRTQFAAFYTMGLPIAIHHTKVPRLKVTAAHAKEMASAEFSRLMDGLDKFAPSMLSELEILENEVKLNKKTQSVKYQLGKDQVNAMWDSIQSSGNIGIDDDPNSLLKRFPVEEDDEIPSFVSKHSKEVRVAANPSLVSYTGTTCSVCREKQFDTPSGICCSNGHGGADPWDEEDWSLEPIKGTFVKQGQPQPATPILLDEEASESEATNVVSFPKSDPMKFIEEVVASTHAKTGTVEIAIDDVEDTSVLKATASVISPDDFETMMSESVSMATPAPSAPRKKLMLLDDEDIL